MTTLVKQGPGKPTSPVRSHFLPRDASYVNVPTYQAPPETIRGVGLNGLWSPGQPTHPIAPQGTSPRGWQFLNYQNMIFTPRAVEDYSFEDLRTLSRYPVARALIEARKGQLANLPWQVRLKQKEGETNQQRVERESGDSTIKMLSDFLARPNFDCDWGDFVQMWADEVLVHDAPAILIRRTRGGDIGEMRVIDGAMIVRYVDQNGWTPQPGSPAYAQLWWGMPSWNLTTDQLFYRPRTPRAHKLYGLSKTEMGAEFIELGWKRLEFMKRHYTDGMVPDAIQVVPLGTSPRQVAQQQAWLNDQLRGNLARLSGLMLLQGFTPDGKDTFHFPKNELATDTQIDELIDRILCFIYGVSVQRLQRQMNRASAESNQEASEEEGLEPDKLYIRDKVNHLIQVKFGYADYEFTFQEGRERDILKQAQTDEIYLTNGVNTINEVRRNKGEDPSTDPAADVLMVKTANGFVPIGETTISITASLMPKPAPGAAPGEEEPGPQASASQSGKGSAKKPGTKKPKSKQPPVGEEPAGTKKPKTGTQEHPAQGKVAKIEDCHCGVHETFTKGCAACAKVYREVAGSYLDQREAAMDKVLAEHLEKSRQAFQLVIDPHHVTPLSEQAKSRLKDKMASRLTKCATAVVQRCKKILGKADDNDKLIKQILDDDDFWTSLWVSLPEEVEPELEDAMLSGMTKSVLEAQIHITDAKLINELNQIAKDWASQHSADMIGMRKDAKGNLVPNPNAAYSIADSTRNAVRKIITQGFEKETPIADLMAEIKNAAAFSDERAATIARSEVQNSQVQGNVDVWNRLGLVQTVKWQTSNNPDVCSDCEANAAAGEIEFGKAFPSGDKWPTAHPNCRCVLVSVKIGKKEQE